MIKSLGDLMNSKNSLNIIQDTSGRASILGIPHITLGGDRIQINDNICDLTPELYKALSITGYTGKTMKNKNDISSNVETQVMFNEANQNIYKISYDEYYTERRVISDMITRVDIGSAQQINSPKHLISAHQTRVSADTPNKSINIVLFDSLNLQKNYVEIDSIRCPRNGALIYYERNYYIEPYRDLKLFFKEKFGEEVMTPFISYPDMKTKSSIEIIDLIHQCDRITPKTIQLFHE